MKPLKLILILICCLMVCGCGEKKSSENNSDRFLELTRESDKLNEDFTKTCEDITASVLVMTYGFSQEEAKDISSKYYAEEISIEEIIEKGLLNKQEEIKNDVKSELERIEALGDGSGLITDEQDKAFTALEERMGWVNKEVLFDKNNPEHIDHWEGSYVNKEGFFYENDITEEDYEKTWEVVEMKQKYKEFIDIKIREVNGSKEIFFDGYANYMFGGAIVGDRVKLRKYFTVCHQCNRLYPHCSNNRKTIRFEIVKEE